MVIEKVEVVPVRSTPGRRIPERRRIIKEKYKKLCVSKNRPWQTPSGGKNTQLSDKKSLAWTFFSSSTNYFQRVYSQCPTAVWTPAGCMMPLLLKLQVLIAKLVSVQTWTNSEHSGRENFKLIYLHIFSPKTLTSFNKHPIFFAPLPKLEGFEHCPFRPRVEKKERRNKKRLLGIVGLTKGLLGGSRQTLTASICLCNIVLSSFCSPHLHFLSFLFTSTFYHHLSLQ